MKFFKPFLLAVAAGMCIGFGGMLNLVCIANHLKILGGILFSIGLLTISLFGFKLFTGQVGYLFAKDDKIAFLGNERAVTSLFKILNEEDTADSGDFKFGVSIHFFTFTLVRFSFLHSWV